MLKVLTVKKTSNILKLLDVIKNIQAHWVFPDVTCAKEIILAF